MIGWGIGSETAELSRNRLTYYWDEYSKDQLNRRPAQMYVEVRDLQHITIRSSRHCGFLEGCNSNLYRSVVIMSQGDVLLLRIEQIRPSQSAQTFPTALNKGENMKNTNTVIFDLDGTLLNTLERSYG